MPKPTFKLVSGGLSVRLRGTNQQTNTGLIFTPGQYSGSDGTLFNLEGIAVAYASLHNRSGTDNIFVGLGGRIPNRLWRAGQWVDATTTYTDDTTDAQDAGASDFALETTTNSDGFVILSRVPFNAISINVGTASVDATDPVRAVRYSSSAGTGWTDMTTADLHIFDGAATEMAAGENLIVFNKPLDWGRTASLVSTIEDGYYALNVRATTAPDTTAALATAIELWDIHFLFEGLDDNTVAEIAPAVEPFYFQHCDALQPLYSVASAANRTTVQARLG